VQGPRVALTALLLGTLSRAGEPEQALLDASGLRADAPAVGAYLRSLQLTAEERAAAQEALRRLSSPDPAERHDALLRLGALRAPPLAALEEAMESPEPDVRRAAQRLREEQLGRVRGDVLRAVLRTVGDERLPGLAAEVLGVAPLAEALGIGRELAGALRGTVRAPDGPLLRDVAARGDPPARAAAVRALGATPGAGADDATPFLGDRDDKIRLAAALALADRGDRRCLDPLLTLLAAPQPVVRRAAADALRATCGGGKEYDPYASPAARADGAAAWARWVGGPGARSSWDCPLPLRPQPLGRTLIAVVHRGQVVEVDAEDRRTLDIGGLSAPWAVLGLPDGRRLVLCNQPATIVEVDTEGAEARRIALAEGFATALARLDNGNLVVAMMGARNTILELRPDGSLLAEIELPGRPFDVQPLDNGRFLVCILADRDRQAAQVIEVDRDGRTHWKLEDFKYPASARRLENGHTLVADAGKGCVREFDSRGRVVWERAGLRQCYSAERLPDGGTLVGDRSGVREIGPDGKEHWILKSQWPTRAVRY
jgi:HEAT repeat protein